MSLKAKIEAVIYASEEPVTLAQLTGLLGEEAQAELDALASRQTTLDLGESEEAVPASEMEVGEPAASADAPAPDASDDFSAHDTPGADSSFLPESLLQTAEAEVPAAERGDAASSEDPGGEAAGDASPDAAVDEKKLARQRERTLREYFRSLLDGLIAEYASGDRGLEIREIAGGFRFATKPEYHDAVRGFVKSLKPPLKLSLQALETLAVVAYKQPVTAPEVSEIRGVDSGGVLAGLMTRKLVATAGRKAVIGRPILYKTTKDFLVRFGLRDINELPSIEEFERMASELAADEPMQEEIPMGEHGQRPNLTEEGSNAEEAGPGDEQGGAAGAIGTDAAVGDAVSGGEPGNDGSGQQASSDVEPMRDVHEAQADGIPSEDSADPDDGDARRSALAAAPVEDQGEHRSADGTSGEIA